MHIFSLFRSEVVIYLLVFMMYINPSRKDWKDLPSFLFWLKWNLLQQESQSAPMLLSPPTSNGHRRRSSVMFSDEVTMVTLGNEQQRNICCSEKMTQTGEGDVWISPKEDGQVKQGKKNHLRVIFMLKYCWQKSLDCKITRYLLNSDFKRTLYFSEQNISSSHRKQDCAATSIFTFEIEYL